MTLWMRGEFDCERPRVRHAFDTCEATSRSHCITASRSIASSASFIARIWSAESVLRICASCLGNGAKPPRIRFLFELEGAVDALLWLASLVYATPGPAGSMLEASAGSLPLRSTLSADLFCARRWSVLGWSQQLLTKSTRSSRASRSPRPISSSAQSPSRRHSCAGASSCGTRGHLSSASGVEAQRRREGRRVSAFVCR